MHAYIHTYTQHKHKHTHTNTHTPPSAAVAIGTIRAATAAAEPPLDPPTTNNGWK